MRLSTITTIAMLASLVPQILCAQQASSTLPQAALMPWRVFGIPSDIAANANRDLRAGTAALAAAWISTPQTLTDFVGRNKQPIIRRNLSQQIIVGNAAQSDATRNLLIEPVWCSAGDQYVIALTAADLKLDHYIAIAHRRVQKIPVGPDRQPNDLRAALAPTLQALSSELATKLQTPLEQNSPETLRVGLRLTHQNTRPDLGSGFCLNLLLAEALLPSTRVLHSIGSEALTHLRDQLAPTQRPSRSSRNIILSWDLNTIPKAPKLPLTYQVSARFNESVFGSRLAHEQMQTIVQLAPAGDRLTLTPLAPVQNFLDQQAKALAPDDKPQIAKVYRAWVYLDRGRAWGLNMNDRVISNDGSGPIYGHVVGFYGPDLKLKSPRGFDISEGAIVYIRKGQRLTKPGQTFEFDPKVFPTPWPPRAAK